MRFANPVDPIGMTRAGRANAAILAAVAAQLRPGVSTAQIDAWVRELTTKIGGRPTQLGYHGFPAAVCTSRNEVVCHGIPRATDVLEEGDILNVDVTTELDGWVGDCSATFAIGRVSGGRRHVLETARRCRDAGIAAIRPGGRVGDIGAAILEVARAAGCSVVKDFGGHGIGRRMHEPPHIDHTGVAGRGPRLVAGMAITVEPMVNLGGPAVRLLPDGWTVVTADGSPSAQFEHTVLITADGPVITTEGPAAADGSPFS